MAEWWPAGLAASGTRTSRLTSKPSRLSARRHVLRTADADGNRTVMTLTASHCIDLKTSNMTR